MPCVIEYTADSFAYALSAPHKWWCQTHQSPAGGIGTGLCHAATERRDEQLIGETDSVRDYIAAKSPR